MTSFAGWRRAAPLKSQEILKPAATTSRNSPSGSYRRRPRQRSLIPPWRLPPNLLPRWPWMRSCSILFRTELEIHSRVLEEGLVETEARQDPQKIQTLMRAAHSLKGAARIVGLDSAVRLAHAMEDMLAAAQRGERQLTGADFDLLLRGTDVFSGLARLEPASIPAALAEASGKIEELAKQFAQPARSASPAATPSVPAAPPASTATPAPAAPPMTETVPKAPVEKTEDASVRVSVENLNRLTGFAGECLVEVKTLHPLTQTVQRIKQRQSALSNAVEQALEAMGKESMA